ncbi:MAG: hypothetical protein PHS03_07390 [Sphaerochaeta sp.]|nr:hypothetical protein [Sphaerochaeta sp.]
MRQPIMSLRGIFKTLPSKSLVTLFILVLLVGVYVGDLFIQRQKEIVLQLFVANDEQDVFKASTLEKELGRLFNIQKNQRVIVDDSLYVVFGSADRYIESSLSKIYAYMAAKELDILIAPRHVVEHYVAGLPMTDLSTLVETNPSLEIITPHLEMAEDSNGQRNTYLLNLEESRYANSDASVLVIPESAPNKEVIIGFLEYLFEK